MKNGAVRCELCKRGIKSKKDFDILGYNRLGRLPKPFHKKCAQKVINEAYERGEGKSITYPSNNKSVLVMTGLMVIITALFFVVVPSWYMEITMYGWIFFLIMFFAFALVLYNRLYSFFSYEKKLR